jgi:hypothetical protein
LAKCLMKGMLVKSNVRAKMSKRVRKMLRKTSPMYPEKAYVGHRDGAYIRRIPFEFTFIEWVEWWEKHLGPDWLTKRGCGGGKYVMARIADKGPYSPGNVRCILHEDNARERGPNGAAPRGENSWSAKLTNAQVLLLYKDQRPWDELAVAYGITPHNVQQIKNGRTWNSVTGHPKFIIKHRSRGYLTEKQVKELFLDPSPNAALARKYDVCDATVHNIKNRKTWRHVTDQAK